MTNPKAIHTVGDSLVSYLNKAFELHGEDLTGVKTCKTHLMGSADFARIDTALQLPALSLYLFRVTVNEHVRNVRRPPNGSGQEVPLALDLHYLLTAWADSAQEEQTTLTWAMRELYLHPVLDSSFLSTAADWNPADVIQITPAELNTEDMMRLWSELEPKYRLSVSYVARVVRIDPDRSPTGQPVVATRFAYAGNGYAAGGGSS